MKAFANRRFIWMAVVVLLSCGSGACSDDDGAGNESGSGLEGGSESGFESGSGTEIGGGEFSIGENISVQVSPETLTFVAGVASASEVTVVNAGTKGSFAIKNAYIKEGNVSFSLSLPDETTIAPLGFVKFIVEYTPTDNVLSDTLVIEHDAPFDPAVEIPLVITSASGTIAVLPNPLHFGSVPFGQVKTEYLTIYNQSQVPVEILDLSFESGAPQDFALENAPQMPLLVNGNDSMQIGIVYTPDGQGEDIGVFRIVSDTSQTEEILVTITGNVTGPKLLAIPGILDFGYVAVGSEKDLTLELRNAGTDDLEVQSVLTSLGTDPSVTIFEGGDAPELVAPDGSTYVTIRYAPTESKPYSLDPIGGVAISSNDANNSTLVIPTYGNVAAPDLLVSPSFVDFGIVALNDTVTREVVLLNKGMEIVDVMGITMIDDSNGEFALSGFDVPGWSVPGQLAPNESVVMILAYTNLGPAGGIASGEMAIVSNDPSEPTIGLPLEAKRGGEKACQFELVPSSLNYGIVPHGNTKTMPITIQNTGTGPCTYVSASTFDCQGFFGFLGGCSQGFGGMSQYFKVIAQPPPIPGGIAQGETATVHIMFVPPSDAPILFDFFDTYQGAVQVTLKDPSNNDAVLQQPEAATPDDLEVNLIAKSGISDISVIPSAVDFGLVTIGCTSPETKITIYNNGNAPLTISDITLQDCTPEFSITQLPPIPAGGLEVNQSNPVEVWVLYTPQVPGTSYCTLAVESTDADQPLLTVPLQGTGTFETEMTDTFVQVSGKMVDILFVVDDSGSMSAEQDNLAGNFQSLIQEANTWGSDYHLGVVTTDIDSDWMSGKLQGDPLYVVNGPSAEPQFQSNVKVGDNGAGFQEAGLEAAHLALSMPLIYESNLACAVDGDCVDPLLCIDGTCSGYNGGFLRDDAALEIVFVSDEEDQSPGPLNFYIDFFKSIKGFANENMMHAHAIVGDGNGGCESSDGSADPGQRYIEVANETGGQFGSICATQFASVLATIGEVAFGLKVQFFLSAIAQPGTVKVWVDGSECLFGWNYDAASNSVVFDENGTCMPQEGQTIDIYYKMLCLQEG